MIPRQYRALQSHWLLVAAVMMALSGSVGAGDDHLSSGEVAAVAAGSVGILALGEYVKQMDSSRPSLITGPLPLESSLQGFLGGPCTLGKTNFLDSQKGSAVTAVAAGLLVFTADVSGPGSWHWEDVIQDQFLFISGLATTKGVTALAKGLVARPRPLLSLHPEVAAEREDWDYAYDHHSFFSGHTSSAFFSTAYANKRIRATMREEMTVSEYRKYRWISPLLSFGWAGFVGWTRIHAYRHFPSDVIVGALTGYLLAELFFSFNQQDDEQAAGSAGGFLVRINIRW